MLTAYSFAVVVDGVELDLDEAATDAIYDGDLDDATVGRFAGWQLVEVDRKAGSCALPPTTRPVESPEAH